MTICVQYEGGPMDEGTLSTSVGAFLKRVGITSQRDIDNAARVDGAHPGAPPPGGLRPSKSALLPLCHGSAGRAGAKAKSEFHSYPRGVRAQPQAPCAGDAGHAR